MENLTISQVIFNQLGGNKFRVMTGSKNFVYQDITATSRPWLRMDLAKNISGVNRLKITLEKNDTYTMEFYRLAHSKAGGFRISRQQTFDNIYAEQLREIFTQVTGFYTSLGTMSASPAITPGINSIFQTAFQNH